MQAIARCFTARTHFQFSFEKELVPRRFKVLWTDFARVMSLLYHAICFGFGSACKLASSLSASGVATNKSSVMTSHHLHAYAQIMVVPCCSGFVLEIADADFWILPILISAG